MKKIIKSIENLYEELQRRNLAFNKQEAELVQTKEDLKVARKTVKEREVKVVEREATLQRIDDLDGKELEIEALKKDLKATQEDATCILEQKKLELSEAERTKDNIKAAESDIESMRVKVRETLAEVETRKKKYKEEVMAEIAKKVG